MKNKHLWWLLLPLALGVRALRLTTSGLWDDEGTSYILARVPLSELWYAVKTYYVSPPLWPLICRSIQWLSPKSLWLIRLPGFAASVVSVALVFRWTLRRYSPRAAWTAATLLSLSPMSVFYAQEGRNYALMSMLYLLSVISADDFMQRGKRRALAVATTASLTNLYLHDVAAALWLGVNAYALLRFFDLQAPRKRLQQWLVAQAVVVVGACLYLPLFLLHLKRVSGANPYALFWQAGFWWKGIAYSLRNLVPGDFSAQSHMPLPHAGYFPGLLSGLAALLFLRLALRGIFQKNRALVTAILVPLFFLSIASSLKTPVYWIGRTEVFVLPLFIVLLSVALDSFKQKNIVLAVFAVFCLGALNALWHYHWGSVETRKHYDAAAAQMVLEDSPQLIIVEKDVRASVAASLMATDARIPTIPFPYLKNFNQETWASKIIEIQKELALGPTESERAVAPILYAIQSGAQNVAIVYATQESTAGFVRHRHTDLLLERLHEIGCRASAPPRRLPMDWHTGGHHSVEHFHCQG